MGGICFNFPLDCWKNYLLCSQHQSIDFLFPCEWSGNTQFQGIPFLLSHTLPALSPQARTIGQILLECRIFSDFPFCFQLEKKTKHLFKGVMEIKEEVA